MFVNGVPTEETLMRKLLRVAVFALLMLAPAALIASQAMAEPEPLKYEKAVFEECISLCVWKPNCCAT